MPPDFVVVEATAKAAKCKADQALAKAQDARAQVCKALADIGVPCAVQIPKPVAPAIAGPSESLPRPLSPKATGAEAAKEDVAKESATTAIASAAKAITATNADIGLASSAIGGARIQMQSFFDNAVAFFGLAGEANPNWFRPGSALGDLYLARAEAPIGDLDNKDNFDAAGEPKRWLNGDDLANALYAYESSIRLNDKNDESLRGRAKVLMYLTMEKVSKPRVVPLNRALRRLFDGPSIDKAQTEILDAAYASAKAACSVANDRNPKDLEIKAQIETELAFQLQPNNSVEYLAQAQETLRQASWYTRSSSDRNRRNNLQFNAGYLLRWELAGFASQNDTRFQSVQRDAQQLKDQVDNVWRILGASPSDDFTKLARATARARRVIREINELEPPAAKQNPIVPGAAPVAAGPPAPPTVCVTNLAPGQTVSVGLAAPNQNASTPPANSDKGVPAYGAQPWPDDQLSMRFELSKRFDRLQAWKQDLHNFCCVVHDSLANCSGWPPALQQALKDAAKAMPTCGSDCD
jgi:hypothetical protein